MPTRARRCMGDELAQATEASLREGANLRKIPSQKTGLTAW